MKNIHNAVAVLSVAALTTLSSPGAATASGPTIKSGQSYEFQFDGNPSTGYKWQLNEAASSGLDIVRVEVLGYDRPLSKLIGAPAPFVFRLTCMAEGFVELQFDYVSPGSEKTVANSHTHWARCE